MLAPMVANTNRRLLLALELPLSINNGKFMKALIVVLVFAGCAYYFYGAKAGNTNDHSFKKIDKHMMELCEKNGSMDSSNGYESSCSDFKKDLDRCKTTISGGELSSMTKTEKKVVIESYLKCAVGEIN